MPPPAKGMSPRLKLHENQMTAVPSALQQFKRNSPEAMVVLKPGNDGISDATARKYANPLPPGQEDPVGIPISHLVGGIVGVATALGLAAVVGYILFRRWAVRTGRVRPRGPPLPNPDTGLTAATSAFAYTDVEGSTRLWEELPSTVMQVAMKLHDRALRKALSASGGYLSATEGDAWVCAFHSATDAVAFALLAQRHLLAAEWPAELLEHPKTGTVMQDGTVLFRGLRVRCGVHVGPARFEKGTTFTGYSGATVDLTRAVGDGGEGGGVLATAEALALASSSGIGSALGGPPALFHAGEYHLELEQVADERKVEVECSLTYVFAPELADRGRALLVPSRALRCGFQISSCCFQAPSGTVALAFARMPAAGLLAWDRAKGAETLAIAASFMAERCLECAGYVAESSPGLSYCSFETAGAALRWACEVRTCGRRAGRSGGLTKKKVQEGLMDLDWPEGVTDQP